MKLKLIVFLLLLTLTLSGCNHTSRVLYNDFTYALFGQQDVALTTEQVVNSRYDYLYLTIDGLPQAVLALGYIKGQQRHWVSADSAVVVLQAGRFVASSGLANDLRFTSNLNADPLAGGLAEFRKRNTWRRQTDWSNSAGYELVSRFQPEQHEVLTVLDQTITTVRIDEVVQVPATGATLQNSFWFDLQSGTLIRSVQQPAPGLPKMEFVYLSDIARLYGLIAKGAN